MVTDTSITKHMKRLPILLTIILILTSCLDESILSTKTSKYEIHYTTSDGQPVYIHYKLLSGFGHVVVSNTYENGLGIIKFKEGVESIGCFEGDGQTDAIDDRPKIDLVGIV